MKSWSMTIVILLFVMTVGVSVVLWDVRSREKTSNLVSLQIAHDRFGVSALKLQEKLVQANEEVIYWETLHRTSDVIFGSPIHRDDFVKYTSPFGIRDNPIKKNIGGASNRDHDGIDIVGVPEGRVLPVARGIVREKWYSKGWHNGRWYKGHDIFDGFVIVDHTERQLVDGKWREVFTGDSSYYGHLGQIYVHEGQIVDPYIDGIDTIGRINEELNGEFTTGAHLHFEIRRNNLPLAPFKYVDLPRYF